MSLTRRSVLKYGLGGAVLVALGGVGLALRGTVMRTPGSPLQVLDARAYSILAAVADRIAPGGGAFPSATALEVPEKIDALLAGCHPAMQAEVIQLLYLFENALAGFLFDQRFQTFSSSPQEVQDQVLEAWRSSRISIRRTAYKALHGLVTAAYYASPQIYAAVGYPGPPDFGNTRLEPPGTADTAPPEASLPPPGTPDTPPPAASSHPTPQGATP